MPLIFVIAIRALVFLGLALPFSRLLWPEVIEGQIIKQSFVVQMIDSWIRSHLDRGFPVRWFVEPWHAGPIPWAEEVPFFHLIAASIAQLTGMNAVQSGRAASFLFALLLVFSIRGIARALFPASPPSLAEPVPPATRAGVIATALAPLLLVWMPGFQIYASSAMPDLAMFGMIAFAYWMRLQAAERPSLTAYAALALACLLKYFAVFALLALFLYDWSADRNSRTSARSRATALLAAALAALPALGYLYSFVAKGIPNPITEYRDVNGYGHLAGPFLLQAKFYSRFLTWTLVKNPSLIWALAALAGVFLARRKFRTFPGRSPGWRLIHLHTACFALFALAFASSFYVHDYYALPFLLPVLLYAVYFIAGMWGTGRAFRLLSVLIATGGLALAAVMSHDATFRFTNYTHAAQEVRAALEEIPDRDGSHLTIFVTDLAPPVLPLLSGKAGWTFDLTRLEGQREHLRERLASPALRAIVFYVREPGGSAQIDAWRAADSGLATARVVTDLTLPAEGPKGTAARLLILQPSS